MCISHISRCRYTNLTDKKIKISDTIHSPLASIVDKRRTTENAKIIDAISVT